MKYRNAGRSQIAPAFSDRVALADVRAESAGTDPARMIWREVIEVMREPGIDVSGRKPKRLLCQMQLHADSAVTIGCGDACPHVPTGVEVWEIHDSAGLVVDELRESRDTIRERVRTLIDDELDAIRSDPTAHELRLAQLLLQLAEEFEPDRTPEEIRACADAVLCRFDDAPIRSHILTLALRRTPECLCADHCDERATPA